MVEQPAGTVTLVFTDIEGSTRLLHELGEEAYRDALAEHRRVVRSACSGHRGYEVDYEGDSFFYAFQSAGDAVGAIEQALAKLTEGPISLRVGIHSGEPGLDPPKYVGMDVHIAARIMSAGHGGQVVLSGATRALIEDGYPVLELGEHRLKDIPAPIALFQLGHRQFPPLKTISNTNIPRPTSSFVGRERELQQVLTRLEEGARLLTLTGPGGAGKTRLALEAATTLVPEYPAGVFWVGLASLRDPTLVIETIGHILGAKLGLAADIGERKMLLLLDNMEQVVEAASELSSLSQSCPNLTLLITSRELLRVQGEIEYPVPPLADAEAVALFCERAQTAKDEEIAELCRRLDALPLAVELAAARTTALSVAQILARLSHRLDLFKGGRDADPRQQTLRATIEWSYDLLPPNEQDLFARLSVFSGGCTFEAAEVICEADLDPLQSLVEKSLLRFTRERYWMLETIRAYAAERLSGSSHSEGLSERHAQYFFGSAQALEAKMFGPLEPEFFAWVDAELDNLRVALAWAIGAQKVDLAARVCRPLHFYWYSRAMFAEGRRWLERILALGRGTDLVALREVLVGAGEFAGMLGDFANGRSRVLESLEIARELADPQLILSSTVQLGHQALFGGDYPGARARYEEALVIYTEVGTPVQRAMCGLNLGWALFLEGNRKRARRVLNEALDLSRVAGSKRTEAGILNNLATVNIGDEAYLEAETNARDALRTIQEMGDTRLVEESLQLLARTAAATHRPLRAAQLTGAADALLAESAQGTTTDQLPHEQLIEAAREELGEQWETEHTRGRQMRLDEAIEVALTRD